MRFRLPFRCFLRALSGAFASRVVAAAGLVCSLVAMPTLAAEAFRVGIAPHTSARVIVAQYQPLRAALETNLARPVEIATARDFTAFAQAALAGKYDLVITTAHQAALLRDDAGYLPLLTYQADFEALAIVAKDGKIDSPRDIGGRAVLGLNPASLVTLWGIDWLEKQKIQPKSTAYVTASDSVAELVLRGEAAAGFISLANLHKLSAEAREGLRVIARSGPIPGRVYLLGQREKAHEKAVRKVLAEFGASAAGKAYFQENQLGGYRPILPAELDAQRSYADAVRRQLRDQP